MKAPLQTNSIDTKMSEEERGTEVKGAFGAQCV
jgi:hypothetical protein